MSKEITPKDCDKCAWPSPDVCRACRAERAKEGAPLLEKQREKGLVEVHGYTQENGA